MCIMLLVKWKQDPKGTGQASPLAGKKSSWKGLPGKGPCTDHQLSGAHSQEKQTQSVTKTLFLHLVRILPALSLPLAAFTRPLANMSASRTAANNSHEKHCQELAQIMKPLVKKFS